MTRAHMLINRNSLLLALVLIYAAGFRLAALNRPFAFDAEGSGCLNGVLARNYLRYNWSQTHGVPVLSSGPAGTTSIVFYPDHPPMLPLLIVPFYAAFGVGAWQTRLPISILTVAAIFVLYRVLANAGAPRAGLAAATLFAATPMTLYFGGFPDVVGMPLVLFVLVTVLAYLEFHRTRRPGAFAGLVGAFALAALCDWPAYVIVPILMLHFVLNRPRREWAWMLALGGVVCALFVATYVYITLATHNSWTWMVPLFTRRSGIVGDNPFTVDQWLGRAFAFNLTYHTLPLLLAAGIWVATFAFRSPAAQPGATVARLLLGWAALYILIGSKALYTHEWGWLPLTPGLAAAAALLVDWTLRRADRFAYGTVTGWAVMVLLVGYAARGAFTTYGDLYAADPSQTYTPLEMGRALQAAAPGPRDVALVFGSEAPAQWWFYGDRALRTDIWTMDDVRRRLNDDTVDLMFHFDVQPWAAVATGFVFPRDSEHDFPALRGDLMRRYPLKPLPPDLAGRFEVFDLRNPLARQ